MDNRLQQEERSTPADFEEIFFRNRRIGVYRLGTDPPPERRSTIGSMLPCGYQNTRMRNLSGGSNGSTASGSSSGSSTQLDNQLTFIMDFTHNSSSDLAANRGGSSSSHRKVDRTCSDNDNDRTGSQRSVNSSRYKTELCRPFEENGSCKYGDKCQFAHGYHELRNLARHPKYKTELCRTFHTVGFCPYGPRCHFIHEEETKPANSSPKLGREARVSSTSGSSSPSLSPSGSDYNIFSYPTETSVDNRQSNALTVNIDYSKGLSDLDILDKRFSGMKLGSNYSNENFFRANNNNGPRLGGSEERDIFSEITMFSLDEVQLDNAPKVPSQTAAQSVRLDNLSYVDTHPSLWQSSYDNLYSQIMRSVDSSSNHSPSSDGSSSGSNHGGSTESLSRHSFTNWRSQVAIGQY